VVDLAKLAVVKTIDVGLQPTAILAANGQVFVANTNSDSISIIDTGGKRVHEMLPAQPFQNASFGNSPSGLTMNSKDELLVSLGGNNAVAVYRYRLDSKENRS
jgi:YVTN family beta-propeller protein